MPAMVFKLVAVLSLSGCNGVARWLEECCKVVDMVSQAAAMVLLSGSYGIPESSYSFAKCLLAPCLQLYLSWLLWCSYVVAMELIKRKIKYPLAKSHN